MKHSRFSIIGSLTSLVIWILYILDIIFNGAIIIPFIFILIGFTSTIMWVDYSLTIKLNENVLMNRVYIVRKVSE